MSTATKLQPEVCERLVMELELALRWLDGILSDWPHELSAPLCKRARAARLPHIRVALDAMPNNWTGRASMREALAAAREAGLTKGRSR